MGVQEVWAAWCLLLTTQGPEGSVALRCALLPA